MVSAHVTSREFETLSSTTALNYLFGYTRKSPVVGESKRLL